jgi:hypothetical protein
MVSSVSYPSNSVVFAFAARMAHGGYTANSADATRGPAKDSVTNTAQPAQAGNGISTYHFTSMTPNQMQGITKDLLNSGKIGMRESLRLQMIGMPFIRDKYSPAQLAEYANKPVNYIQEIKGQLEFLKHGGYANDPKSGYEGLKNLLATLQQMQGTTSSVNVTA